MKLLFNKAFLLHKTEANHPENPERLKHFSNLPNAPIEYNEENLYLVHSKNMLTL
jgi:acetoin utilization deacetylase AcuC-like enzyme